MPRTPHDSAEVTPIATTIQPNDRQLAGGSWRDTFRSLSIFNYRVWAGGALVSNVGTWMQRTAQDWIVLTQLSHTNSATSVGIVTGLQFAPQVLLLPITGYAADHFDRRKLLIATQTCMGALALGLGLDSLSGLVQLWHVYVFAFLLGCVAAFDAPVRQTFVSELVPETHLSNAVGLNSTSFNAGRMLGPAAAGVLIAGVGAGWVFLINAASFAAVIGSLLLLRTGNLRKRTRASRARGGLSEGFRYVWRRPDLMTVLVMFFLIGTFGINFPIFISTMSVGVFGAGASEYGFLTSMMAVGSVIGSLLAARRDRPKLGFLLAGAAAFGTGLALAASMPTFALFGIALVLVGLAAQTFTTTANSSAQLWTDSEMRGRVMAIVMATALGGTPIGGPLLGWVADTFGPRWSMAMGATSGFAAALVGVYYLWAYRNLRVGFSGWRLQITFDGRQETAAALEIPEKRTLRLKAGSTTS